MGSVVLLPPGGGPTPLPPPSPYPGPAPGQLVTVADVERALGQRVGPYAELMAQQGLAPAQVQVDALRSSAETAGWENLFVLRRGVYAAQIATTPPAGIPPGVVAGDPVPNFSLNDRTRLVKSFAAESGSLEVDRAYTTSVVPGEALELHVLHPEWELRPAVLQGLERTFLFDRIPAIPAPLPPPDPGDPPAPEPPVLPPAPALPVGDLTFYYPWLTDRTMVWGVEWGPSSDGTVAAGNPYGVFGLPLRGWDAMQGAGAVFLQLPFGNRGLTFPPTTIWVAVRRPGWSWVNGTEWTPEHVWQDGDVLAVPISYATAAAHVAAWRVARTRLMPGASTGMALTENDCGRELTRQTARYFRPDVRPPEDRYPGPTRYFRPDGRRRAHWSRRQEGGRPGWIANA